MGIGRSSKRSSRYRPRHCRRPAAFVHGRAWLLVSVVCLSCGCLSMYQPVTKTSGPASLVHPQGVKLGGAGLVVNDVQRAAFSPEDFVARIESLLARQRPGTARRVIERYPDLALEALRAATCAQAPTRALTAIAAAFDRQCCASPSESDWTAVCRQRAARPEQFKEFDAGRARLLSLMAAGHWQEAAGVRLVAPKGAAHDLLSIDGDDLVAQALLRANCAADAVKVLTRAAQACQPRYPYQAVHVLLALSDAQRGAGQDKEANAAWQEAVVTAAGLVGDPRAVNDPILWERLAAERPVTLTWPSGVGRQVAAGNPASSEALVKQVAATVSQNGAPAAEVSADETLIWEEVGRWRQERGELQAAVLAFKHAEGATADEMAKDRLQLSQGEALAEMGQDVLATNVLVHLALKEGAPVSRPALAALGALRFQEGHAEQALAMLQKAVEQDPNGAWPGRFEAEADLGLAYLTVGDEKRGLDSLHAAEQQLEQARKIRRLLQCLDNEAAYFEHEKKTEQAASIRQRIQQIEQS